MLGGSRRRGEISDLRRRVEKLESQISFLYRDLGLETGVEHSWKPSHKVMELVERGRKLEAIKEFRAESGASLRDAKAFIETLLPPKQRSH